MATSSWHASSTIETTLPTPPMVASRLWPAAPLRHTAHSPQASARWWTKKTIWIAVWPPASSG
jgi:hypothetical protein